MPSFFLLLIVVLFLAPSNATPLDDYVWADDGKFEWSLSSTWRGSCLGKGYTGYQLNMTSQQWLTDADFAPDSQTKSIWHHVLVVLVPDKIDYQKNATIYLTGGDANTVDVQKSEDVLLTLALSSQSNIVAGVLFQVPNQHVTFADDPIQKSRSEDAVIAYTWDHYLRDTSRPDWLVRFPMVKAAVKAMDAMREFALKELVDKQLQLEYFTVSGASKRGWTTWLVGAVDPSRVMLIVPVVLDAINFVDVIHHQYRSYDGWSFALTDYLDMNIMQRIDTPEMRMLQEMEDPYMYASRLTVPKLVVNAALDEFQQPDDNLYWWADMPEPKHIMMVPNAEHSMATGLLEAVPGISAWIAQHLKDHRQVPTFTWRIAADTGAVTATLDGKGEVHEARAWWGYSCGTNVDTKAMRRDYRVISVDDPCSCGIRYDGNCINLKSFWSKEVLQPTEVNGQRTYTFYKDAPGDGRYVAYFIEIEYKKIGRAGDAADASDAARRALSLEDARDEAKKAAQEAAAKLAELKDDVAKAKTIVDALRHAVIPEFPKDLAHRLVFTTQVSVHPQSFPFADCVGNGIDTSTCTDVMR